MSSAKSYQKLQARPFALDDLVEDVRNGIVRVPQFQRRFRWTSSDVTRLFDSIYRGYPIGTLLFWLRPAPAGRVKFGGVEWDVPEVSEAYWVVDGQQRVTSLTLAVSGEHFHVTDKRFSVLFDPATEEFLSGETKNRTLRPMLSVETAFDLAKVLDWVSENDVTGEARDRAFGLAKRLRGYNVPTYLVDAEDEQAVREIFDRMNTFGRRMKRSEVFDAIHSASGETGIGQLSWVGAAAADLAFGELDEQLLLYSILATRGTDVLRDFHKEFADDSDKMASFDGTRETVGKVIQFLREHAGIPHEALVPHQHLFVSLVRFFHLFPAPADQTLVLLRRWFWRAALLGPNLKGGTTGTLRQSVAAIDGSGEHAGVAGLLRIASASKGGAPAVDAGSTRLSTADGRIVVAALFSLGPLNPQTLEPVDPDDLLGEERSPIPRLLPRALIGASASEAGNRALYRDDDLDTSFLDQAQRLDAAGQAQLFASHLIDEKFLSLAADDPKAAFEHRSHAVTSLVESFVSSRAEWDLLTRASVALLIAEDNDDDDVLDI